MNTTEIIYEIARRSKQSRHPLTRQQAKQTIDLFLNILEEELSQPVGEVRLKRIGILKIVKGRYPSGRLKQGKYSSQKQINTGHYYYKLKLCVSRTLRKRLRSLA